MCVSNLCGSSSPPSRLSCPSADRSAQSSAPSSAPPAPPSAAGSAWRPPLHASFHSARSDSHLREQRTEHVRVYHKHLQGSGGQEQQRQADSLEACLLTAACCSVFSESRLEKEACRLTCAVLLSTSSWRKINSFRCKKIILFNFIKSPLGCLLYKTLK